VYIGEDDQEHCRKVEADNPGQAFHKTLKQFKVKTLIRCCLRSRVAQKELYQEFFPPKNWDLAQPKHNKSKDVQLEMNL
jgi:hypothetical protein